MNHKKERNSSFELMRILSMLMVCAFHWQLHGNNDGIIASSISINQIISFCLGSWGILGVNLFFLLSFYYLINKDSCNYKRIIGLIIKVSIYGTLVFVCFVLQGRVTFNSIDFIKSVLGIFAYQYWFISVYVVVALISPYLNRLLNLLSKRETFCVWAIMFYVTYILSWILGNEIAGRLSCGVTLYITIFLLTKRATKLNEFLVRYRKMGGILFVLTILIECLLSYLNGFIPVSSKIIMKLQTTASPVMFILALFIFYIFKEWNIGTIKSINMIGAYSSGAYLLHGGAGFIKAVLWDGMFQVGIYYNGPSLRYLFHYLICILGLFCVGIICEWLYTCSIGKVVDKIFEKCTHHS